MQAGRQADRLAGNFGWDGHYGSMQSSIFHLRRAFSGQKHNSDNCEPWQHEDPHLWPSKGAIFNHQVNKGPARFLYCFFHSWTKSLALSKSLGPKCRSRRLLVMHCICNFILQLWGWNFSCLGPSMYVEDLVYLQSQCGALEVELPMSGGAVYLFPHPCAGAQG